jgi:hypothetical protein
MRTEGARTDFANELVVKSREAKTDFEIMGRKNGCAKKEEIKKIKEKRFLLFSEFSFGKRII